MTVPPEQEFGHRAHQLFLEALEQPTEAREGFLEQRTAGKPALLEEVRSLLQSHDSASGFLAEPALPIGAGHPDRIGPYQVVEVLGEGGMGTVYLAEQTEPVRRRVALKIIKLGMDTRRVQSRFQLERQALAMMSHPGIARVFDGGTTGRGQAYFAMEYVDGQAITDYCEQRQLALRSRLRLMVTVCRAVQHAHQKGILHRDLKPSNVLVAEEDGEARPRVIDFGVARALHADPEERITRTGSGGLVGTPDYVSPEQAGVGGQDVDTRTDVYSLGVLLYELVAGTRPYQFDSGSSLDLLQVRQRLERDEPPRPSRRGRPVSAELEWVILKAIATDRSRRYDTPNELADELERFLAREPVLAGPPSASYKLWKFAQRNVGGVVAGAAVLASLLAGAGAAGWGWWQAEQANLEVARLLGDYRNVADDFELEDLRERAASLWPAWPERVPAMEAWIRQAEALVGRLDFHQGLLADGPPPADAQERRDLYERRLRLVGRLVGFRDGEDAPDSLPALRARVALAHQLAEQSAAAGTTGWPEAAAAIADPARCPAYDGLRISPQAGLAPLGPDPESGFWEFLVVGTGAAPVRGDDGRFRMDVESGVVMVLLPGGEARIGTTKAADPDASGFEVPVNRARLDPFFLAKYELSAAQWWRLQRLGRLVVDEVEGPATDLRTAMASVDWYESRELLGRVGLDLPSELQWEYGARAGTTSRWSFGDDPEAFLAFANLRDRSARQAGVLRDVLFHAQDDGFGVVAPIGQLLPNGWGLHDVHGNVYEWCLDRLTVYPGAAVPDCPGTLTPFPGGAGYRQLPASVGEKRVVRGGGYQVLPWGCRSSFRVGQQPERRGVETGLRPARPLF